MTREFHNEPLVDFSNPDNRGTMEQAIRKVESQLGREWSAVINGKRIKCKDQFFSHSPADPDQVIGIFQKGDVDVCNWAIEASERTFNTWRKTSAEERAEYCFRTADIMRRRKAELAAWVILETGKSWVEADADIAEGIDLVEFYGHEVLRYAEQQPLTRIPTEDNELRYIPLGVGIVIPPWNFPIAILAGTTTSAFAAGNSVILKPSSDAPGTAKRFVEILEEADVPPGVVNLVTGPGNVVGEVLVADPRTRFISFTGSKEVGVHINEVASRIATGQKWLKRVIAEMGGKNAIIVDSEADMAKAAEGVVVSAFGYSGQKCSACSRCIVDVSVYEEFMDRLCERTRAVRVGDPRDPETFMGPLINMRAAATVLDYIEIGQREGRLVLGGKQIGHKGYFVEPTIITDVDPRATIAQEEIFGPVLAVLKAQDFQHAVEIGNATQYGLTGSVYTENEEKLRIAADDFHAGNLYFNRKCTGAVVGAHPFGGFNMSGTDSKAGGRDYMLLLTQAKSVSRLKS